MSTRAFVVRRHNIVLFCLATVLLTFMSMQSAFAADSGSSDNWTGRMTFVAWGGTTQKAEYKAFVQPFAKKYNVTVAQAQPTNYAKIKAMVKSGHTTWDVVDAEPPIVKKGCGTLFQKLDFSKIDTSHIPKDMLIGDCAVPSYRTGIVVAYNTKAYSGKPAPTTWADFFNTKKYPGKRAIGPSALYVIEGVMKAAVGSNDKVYPIDYKKVFDKLDSIKGSLLFWKTGAQAIQMMNSGRVNMILTWPGRIATAVNSGAPYKVMWKTGIFTYDVWAIPKGAPDAAVATKFINYALQAQPQTEFNKLVAYAPTNADAEVASPDSPTGKFSFTFDRQDKYDVLVRNQDWWVENWDTAIKKYNAWKFK